MQANFFELEYNPKIDYLITKNLLYAWPKNFNEFDLRKAYRKRFNTSSEELNKLKKIRNYLRKNKLFNFTCKNYEKLVSIITNQKFEYHYRVSFSDMTFDELDKYVDYLRSFDSNIVSFACLSVMFLYLASKKNIVIIPYRGTIKRFLSNENLNSKTILTVLKERTRIKNQRHDPRVNKLIHKVIKDKKEEFLNEFKQVKSYGIFGSFAMNKENEYSDLDMLIVCDEDYINELEYEIKSYWKQFFDIEMDVKIVKEDEIDQELTECMKMTLKMVN